MSVVLAVPDLVSPSYFPAIAAVDLGFVRDEGVDARLELRYPVTDAAVQLHDGGIDLLAGAAHAPLHAFPGWRGAALVMALSRHTYWFLVVRTDRAVARGDLGALRDMTIGAAPGPDLALHALLADADVDPVERGITIGRVPGKAGAGISFGMTAAEALRAGEIDAFWANGMGAEVAVRDGIGTVVVDARRDGPPGNSYTFPALAVARRTLVERPDIVAATVRAVRRAQQVLRADPGLASEVGRRLFPPMEADLVAELVARDAPFYDPVPSPEALAGLHALALRSSLDPGDDPAAALASVDHVES